MTPIGSGAGGQETLTPLNALPFGDSEASAGQSFVSGFQPSVVLVEREPSELGTAEVPKRPSFQTQHCCPVRRPRQVAFALRLSRFLGPVTRASSDLGSQC